MFLPRLLSYVPEPRLLQSSIVGNSYTLSIDRTWPLQEIRVIVDFTVGSDTNFTMTADGYLGFLKRIQLITNTGKLRPGTVVDMSGVCSLERAQHLGLTHCAATQGLIAEHTKATPALTASSSYRVTYRIPLIPPCVVDPLRSRMLLPLHRHKQDAILRLDFSTLAEMNSHGSAVAPTAATAWVQLVRRAIPATLDDAIWNDGGYIESDILETPFNFASGASGEQKLDVPLGGKYIDVILRQYSSGASVMARGDISASTAESTATLKAIKATLWTMRSGQATFDEWRMAHLKDLNEETRPLQTHVQTVSPNIGPVIASV
jgi:hypothetical protein